LYNWNVKVESRKHLRTPVAYRRLEYRHLVGHSTSDENWNLTSWRFITAEAAHIRIGFQAQDVNSGDKSTSYASWPFVV